MPSLEPRCYHGKINNIVHNVEIRNFYCRTKVWLISLSSGTDFQLLQLIFRLFVSPFSTVIYSRFTCAVISMHSVEVFTSHCKYKSSHSHRPSYTHPQNLPKPSHSLTTPIQRRSNDRKHNIISMSFQLLPILPTCIFLTHLFKWIHIWTPEEKRRKRVKLK